MALRSSQQGWGVDQPGKKTRQVDGGVFATAAVLAPGIALAIFFLAISFTKFSVGPGDIVRLIGSFLFLLLIVTCWGALPSFVFGGLVLVAVQRTPFREGPAAATFVIGGAVAAGLYVLTGLGAAALYPGLAMFFAPWATPDLRGPGVSVEDGLLVTSLLMAGAGAGLIYSTFAKRG